MNRIKVIHEEDIELDPDRRETGKTTFEIPSGVIEGLFHNYPEGDIILPLGVNIPGQLTPYYRKDHEGPSRKYSLTEDIEEDRVRVRIQVLKKE